jgi:hypothetical protein
MDVKEEIERLYEMVDAFTKRQVKEFATMGPLLQLQAALIASHPEPTRLLAEWRKRRDSWDDAEMDAELLTDLEYRATYNAVVDEISRQIEAAAGKQELASAPKH